MKPQTLINFRVTPDTKAKYQAASDVIGVSISEICRKALDNAIILAETLKTQKPNGEAPVAASPSDQAGATPAVPAILGKGEPPSCVKGFLHAPTSAINTKGVFVRKGEEWVEKKGVSNEAGA